MSPRHCTLSDDPTYARSDKTCINPPFSTFTSGKNEKDLGMKLMESEGRKHTLTKRFS